MNFQKFSFGELTSNSKGKTSASGTMGILICVVGTLCFLLGSLDKMFFTKDIDIITQAVIFTGMGVTLLGYHKSQEKHLDKKQENSMPIKNETEENG